MIVSAFGRALVEVVDLLLTIYVWLIIARAIISWVNPSPYHPVVRFLDKVTEPVLHPLRRIIPSIYGLDLTPIVVIFFIYFLKEILRQVFYS
ncbi:MAG: YggT family protein [Caldimicrobium sp.]|nr:YggT family protein [Caldimicrobium sp.]MCX7874426.1 YggT family protein [Caldimicrobium sp.]MDW8093989.1 YggT family protein [Caldimicrobium sp.]